MRLLWTVICCAVFGVAVPGCERLTSRDTAGSPDVGPGGRSQPLALTPQQELATGRRAYQQVIHEFRDAVLSEDNPDARRVNTVSTRLIKAAEIEPLQREILLRVRGYRFEWEERVVRNQQVNAFCLPAGKIVVFTGLLPVASNDDQLATVVGHEMAHALAHHGSERVAREQSGSNILRSLSYDRAQESEADHIGLFLMTFAGYEPDQAVAFWERMHSAAGKGQPFAFLSDHPSDEHRVRDLRAWAPKAKAAKKAFDEGRIAASR